MGTAPALESYAVEDSAPHFGVGAPGPFRGIALFDDDAARPSVEAWKNSHSVQPAAALPLALVILVELVIAFLHVAIAVDPRSGIIYQTEDQVDSLIDRGIPDQPG